MNDYLQASDEELVFQAKGGNHACMEALLNRYKHVVRARARSFFLAGGETEDLIQEGMVGLYEAITAYDSERSNKSSFKTFAALCISRRIIDAVKHASREKNTPLNNSVSISSLPYDIIDDCGIDEQLIRTEDRTEFLQKIGKILSPFEFQIVVMYMDGMTSVQMSEATGKDGKSIDNALQRSKKKLKSIYNSKE
ncbi:MAG: sigma-70 family RNA polymerase sigma factor [Clostridia bacterium]|nr:sigma-70 family RNA polymerase sigma factor [Clostridia bacterium]